MKLIRFGPFRKERPGVELPSGVRKDCSGEFSDWNAYFFANGGLAQLADLVKSKKGDRLPDVPTSARLGAPIARPGKIVCIGLNYSDHAKESGMEVPKEPIVF